MNSSVRERGSMKIHTFRARRDLAKVGIHAVKQGPVLKENIKRILEKGEDADLKVFKPYLINPIILSTGVGDAYWGTSRFALRGKWALKLKHYLDKRFVDQYT
jgi:selenide,water dikinase